MAQRAAKGQPTLYAQLMDFALAGPRAEIVGFLDERFAGLAGSLASELCEELRKAYTAGVIDGYRQALQDSREPSDAA